MIGAILGAAVSLGSHVIGGLAAAKERRKQKEELDAADRRREAWYTREKYTPAEMRAAARYAFSQNEEAARKRFQQAKGRGGIMGNADAQIAAAQEANAQGLSDLSGKIAAEGDVRTDRIEEQNLQQENDLMNKRLGYYDQSANNISSGITAAGGVAQTIFSNNAGEKDTKKAKV